jgi:hypothetical protein
MHIMPAYWGKQKQDGKDEDQVRSRKRCMYDSEHRMQAFGM